MRQRPSFRKIAFIFVITTLFFAKGEAAADIVRDTDNVGQRMTVAVMPFFASGGEKQAWLSKGLADLLITDLGQINEFAVLERATAQAFIDELELGTFAGDTDNVLRMGQVAAVDLVLYGQYALAESGELTINILLYDVKQRRMIKAIKVNGALKSIRSLLHDAALEISESYNVQLNTDELNNIRFSYTDSLQATKRFYLGIDAFDQGNYADAMGEFLAAYKTEPLYNEALLWTGRMQEYLGMTDHALATYLKLYESAPDQVIAKDALLFAGKLAQDDLQDLPRAYELFSKVYQENQRSAHQLIATFHMAEINRALFNAQDVASSPLDLLAYQQFQEIASFVREKKKLPRQLRKSAFYDLSYLNNLNKSVLRNLVALYGGFDLSQPSYQQAKLPLGVFVVDPENPEIGEKLEDSQPLFSSRTGEYYDSYYAVLVPKGYKARAVDIELTGVCSGCARIGGRSGHDFSMQIHEFPLPRDHYSKWLGTLYGQSSEVSTLRKTISFHGQSRSVFVIKLNEGGGKIHQWKIRVDVIKDEVEKPSAITASNSHKTSPAVNLKAEGALVSTASFDKARHDGVMRTMKNYFGKNNKRELAMAKDSTGVYHLVSVVGGLTGARTDLWHTTSKNLEYWDDSQKLPISSLSKDYFPSFVKADDGSLQLFWVSNRRAQGWGLWTSRYDPLALSWSDAQRISLPSYSVATDQNQATEKQRLDYAVTQTSRGQWLVVYQGLDKKQMVVMASKNLKDWTERAVLDGKVLGGLAIMEDQTGKFRIAGHDVKTGKPHMYKSNNGKRWKYHSLNALCPTFMGVACSSGPETSHQTQLLSYDDNQLLFLTSDNVYGLKFAAFDPNNLGDKVDKIDLVSKIHMQPYSIIRDGSHYLVASKNGDQVDIRRYKSFRTTAESGPVGGVYNEVEYDQTHNKWERIFATQRYILPDVTATDIGPDGTQWWGIETGIMALGQDNSYFHQDVSGGYFYHYTSDIESCESKRAYVSSDTLVAPVLGLLDVGGMLKKVTGQGRNETVMLNGGTGAVTDILCTQDGAALYAATSGGDLFTVSGQAAKKIHTHSTGGISALALSGTGELFFGTNDGHIFRVSGSEVVRHVDLGSEIYDLTFDQSGELWIAAAGRGLLRYTAGERFDSPVSYANIGKLVADPDKGVWYIVENRDSSRGLGYFDGKREVIYNPPSHILDRPSDLKVKANGKIIIGTWFDGLYSFTPEGRL